VEEIKILKGRVHLEEISLDGSILEKLLEKQGGWVWTSFI
jgi:hypothetical protein